MSTSVKEGISSDETISAVTPVPLEKGDTAKMSPTKHVHIQAAPPPPQGAWPFRDGTLQTAEGLWKQAENRTPVHFCNTSWSCTSCRWME